MLNSLARTDDKEDRNPGCHKMLYTYHHRLAESTSDMHGQSVEASSN